MALFTTWAFGFKLQSYFPQSLVPKTGLIFYLADFHGRNWRIPGFYENKTQHWALFSTKPNQGRFYHHWALLLKWSRKSCSCQSSWNKLSSEFGLKVGFKELRLEPKFLNHRNKNLKNMNHRLWINKNKTWKVKQMDCAKFALEDLCEL